MATMYPPAISAYTESSAEIKLFSLLKSQLSDEHSVFHSVKWIAPKPSRYGSRSEADFIVAHPSKGLLIIEVKGGRIELRSGHWYSTDRNNIVHKFDDPFEQASKSVYALKDWLKVNRQTRHHTYPIFHCVAFPDLRLAPDEHLRPDIPRDIVIDGSQLADIAGAVERIYDYWRARYDLPAPGASGIGALVGFLVPSNVLKSPISSEFEKEDAQFKQLTEKQYYVLRMLRGYRRAAIVGGAGTGKTMLAIEKAKQLARDGHRTLLVCYNSNLAAWLSRLLRHEPDILVSTYHRLIGIVRSWAILPQLKSSEPNTLEAAPDHLQDALDRLRQSSIDREKYLFDALVIDEGQDFQGHYWIPVADLLKSPADGIIYIFFDDNQRIYSQLENIPITRDQPPFFLTENCRNTQHIFDALNHYKSGDQEASCNGPVGRPVQIVPATDKQSLRTTLQKTITNLVDHESVEPSDMVLLTPRRQEKSIWQDSSRLGKFTLTWDLNSQNKQALRVCTIHGFKGLERPVVILSELDAAHEEVREQLLYIGVSRARNHLIILGDLPAAKPRPLTRESRK